MPGVDNLSHSSGSGTDMLTLVSGSGTDLLTKGSATALDNLTRGTVSITDPLAKEVFTHITAAGELDDTTPIAISVEDTSLFPSSGTGKVQLATGEEMEFDWTGKTATTLTGCVIASGTFEFSAGDKVYV